MEQQIFLGIFIEYLRTTHFSDFKNILTISIDIVEYPKNILKIMKEYLRIVNKYS